MPKNEKPNPTANTPTDTVTEATKRDRICPVNQINKGDVKPYIVKNGAIEIWPVFTAPESGTMSAEDSILARYGDEKIAALKSLELYDQTLELEAMLLATKRQANNGKLPESVTSDDLAAFPSLTLFPLLGTFAINVGTVDSLTMGQQSKLADFGQTIIDRMNGKTTAKLPVLWNLNTLEAMVKIAGCCKLDVIERTKEESAAINVQRNDRAKEITEELQLTDEQLKLAPIAEFVAGQLPNLPRKYSVTGGFDNDALWTEVIAKNPRPAGETAPANQ